MQRPCVRGNLVTHESGTRPAWLEHMETEVGEKLTGLTVKGLVDHGKDFGFYSKTKGKPSEGLN